MNNLYVIRKEDQFQQTDEVGLIEKGQVLKGIDGSLPSDLVATDWQKGLEHRCHKRFRLYEDAFALIRPASAGSLKIYGKSMGGIACAVYNTRPAKLGKIDNISLGGLMFHHVDNKALLNKALVLDILLADCGFYMANIPYKTITDLVIPEDDPGDPIEMRQVGLQFIKLNVIQQEKLKDFIFKHGKDTGQIDVND